VVGFVDWSRSDVGWLVKGVSGCGACVFGSVDSIASALVAGMAGSSTGSADR
jgi:hypothetical protein